MTVRRPLSFLCMGVSPRHIIVIKTNRFFFYKNNIFTKPIFVRPIFVSCYWQIFYFLTEVSFCWSVFADLFHQNKLRLLWPILRRMTGLNHFKQTNSGFLFVTTRNMSRRPAKINAQFIKLLLGDSKWV